MLRRRWARASLRGTSDCPGGPAAAAHIHGPATRTQTAGVVAPLGDKNPTSPVSGSVTLTDDQFFDFCQINRDLRIERTAEGALVLMAPAGGLSTARNLELCRQLANWAQRDGRGIAPLARAP